MIRPSAVRATIVGCLLAGLTASAGAQGLPRAGGAVTGAIAGIDFGDDSSQWANDGECDDPRFEGQGMHGILLDEDLKRDASDCRAAFASGAIRLKEPAAAATPAASVAHASGIDFGDDSGQWANDGECDDPRFRGTGMHGILLNSDLRKDATDCRTLFERGQLGFRDVYRDDYMAGAPFATDGIDFGTNDGEWADDGECDDPRFEGPGTGLTADPDTLKTDADDCRTAFIAGRVALRPQAEIDRIGQD